LALEEKTAQLPRALRIAMNIASLVPYLFLGSFFSLLLLALWILG